jgi:hypothetical protein
MAATVADFLLERLRAWGVDHVFAYAGDGINGILAAWGRAENKPKFVQARHEEMAAFEAVGYAKFTGRVGVCMATSGPGAIHLPPPSGPSSRGCGARKTAAGGRPPKLASPAGGRRWRWRPASKPTQSTRCCCSASFPPGCRTTRS